jgi:hypothetical protein
MVDQQHLVHAVYADSLAPVPHLDSTAGGRVAMQFARALSPQLSDTVRARYLGVQSEPDQWTLEQPIPAQLPMLRYELTDADGTQLYVSTVGAEVVTGTTRRGRALAWIGAIPHWIYPTLLRRHVAEWSWIVIVLAAFGTVMSVTGMAVGLWQWRWRPRQRSHGRERARSPYHDLMMRWHHITGLVFGAVTCTWIFSGMMSMNPGEWSPGTSPAAEVTDAWASHAAARGMLDDRALAIGQVRTANGGLIRELRMTALGAQPFWLGLDSSGVGTLVRLDLNGVTNVRVPDDDVVRTARRALRNAELADSLTLTAYDGYYRPVEGRPPSLPVLRLRFRDPRGTWLYVEPGSGRILESYEARSRLERWLYTGLHDLDFAWLAPRPLWDLVVIVLSIGGALASLTGLVVAWRWLQVVRGAPRSVRRR